ncbi:MAG: type IV pilus assembly protein PilM [Candidatus Coatesbacteria bacterium]
MTPTTPLPARPDLEHLKNQSEALARSFAAGDPQARARVAAITRLRDLAHGPPRPLTVAQSLLVIAREYGFPSWPSLKRHVESRHGRVTEEVSMNTLKINLHKPSASAGTAPLAGLDLGSAGMRAVLLDRAGDGVIAAGLAAGEVGAEAAGALARLVRDCGFPLHRVAVGLAGDRAHIRASEMPKMGSDEFRAGLPLEIEQYLPIDPEESVMDFEIHGDSKTNSSNMDVLLAAGRAEAAKVLLELAAGAGLEPGIVDVDELALANMFALNYGDDPAYRDGTCLINVGHRMTSVVILSDGRFSWSRPIMLAGESFTKDIRAEFALDMWQAEEFKREKGKVVVENSPGLAPSPEELENGVLRAAEAMMGSLNNLLAEVKRCLDFHETKLDARGVKRIMLCGGGSRLRNLDRFLGGSLELPVEFANPFRKIRVDAGVPGAGLAAAHAAIFGVAVGLALRRFD